MNLPLRFVVVLMFFSNSITAQETSPAKQFWEQLQSHCGKAYEGSLVLPEEDKDFGGKQLVMHVRSCTDSLVRIPFFVGEDKSRTWVLSYKNDRISLKHDHRHEDGTEDTINFYGGTSSNTGKANIQFFPADTHTQQMIPAAATNVWWITLDENEFTYNLQRLGTDRIFKVSMNLKNPIAAPAPPWGWKD